MKTPGIENPGGKILRINDGRLVRFWYTQFDTTEIRAYVKRKQISMVSPIATIPDDRQGKRGRMKLGRRV